MPLVFVIFLPAALAMGWYGTRTALHIRHSQGRRVDELLMAALSWAPLASWLVALAVYQSRWTQ
jgi:hypothetical protein